MRMFFITVGILAWLFALSVLWIFAESGGALAVIAAGVFAGVAIVSLGLERVLKMLEEIRDGGVSRPLLSTQPGHVELRDREVVKTSPSTAIPA
jgi:hypothetical protein